MFPHRREFYCGPRNLFLHWKKVKIGMRCALKLFRFYILCSNPMTSAVSIRCDPAVYTHHILFSLSITKTRLLFACSLPDIYFSKATVSVWNFSAFAILLSSLESKLTKRKLLWNVERWEAQPLDICRGNQSGWQFGKNTAPGCLMLVQHSSTVPRKDAGALTEVIKFKTSSQKRLIKKKGSQHEVSVWPCCLIMGFRSRSAAISMCY